MLVPFHRKESPDSEKVSDLPKITRLLSRQVTPKVRRLLPVAVKEILMKPTGLVSEEGAGLSRSEQTEDDRCRKNEVPPQQEASRLALTMKVVPPHVRFPGRHTGTFPTSLSSVA